MPATACGGPTPARRRKRTGAGSAPATGGGPWWLASSSAEQRLDGLARHTRSLSPQHVLERGFAVVRRLDGTVVRDPGQVQEGEVVELSVARGLIAARVEPLVTPDGAGRRGHESGWDQ